MRIYAASEVRFLNRWSGTVGSMHQGDASNIWKERRPMNPSTKGRMMRHDDHGDCVPASVRAKSIETRDGARIRFPIQSMRLSLCIKDDSFVKCTWRNGMRNPRAAAPMGRFIQKIH